jgi:hypothetical protein
VKPALTPESQIDTLAAELAKQYNAKGDLELMFVRQLASASVTYDSLQRAINSLDPSTDAGCAQIDRLSRTQVRYQRMQAVAIKELKGLQERRNIAERFPDQTRDCAPLADHTLFIGEKPRVKPVHWSARGRMPSPLDNTPMRVSTEGGIKHLVPDTSVRQAAAR